MISLCKMHAQTHIYFQTFNFYKLRVSMYLNNGFNLSKYRSQKTFLKINLWAENKALQTKFQKLKTPYSWMENMQSFKNNQFCKGIHEWKVLERRQRINFPKGSADKIVVGTFHSADTPLIRILSVLLGDILKQCVLK